MKKKITVTKQMVLDAREAIAHGSLRSVSCPVAKAMSEKLGTSVTVGIFHWGTDGKCDNKIPKRVRDFINKFDVGHKVMVPVSFYIDV